MRIDRLRLLRDWFATRVTPEEFSIHTWAEPMSLFRGSGCGTVCCIAGHAGFVPEFVEAGFGTNVTTNDVYYRVPEALRESVREYLSTVLDYPPGYIQESFDGQEYTLVDGDAANAFFEMPQQHTTFWYSGYHRQRNRINEYDDFEVTPEHVISALDELINGESNGTSGSTTNSAGLSGPAAG